MRFGKILACSLLLQALSQGMCFGAKGLQQDFQNWDIVTLTFPVTPNKKLLWYGEAQPRVGFIKKGGDYPQPYMQLLLRTALGYQLTEHVSVWQGYAWTPVFEPDPINEHLIYQQITLTGNFRRLGLSNRTQLQERWIEGTNGATALRLRSRFKGLYPLDKKAQWFFSISDEFFFNLNSVPNGPKAGFDQNRFFVGLHRKVGSFANAELGYQNQYVNRDVLPDRMSHAIMLMVNFHAPAKKTARKAPLNTEQKETPW